MGEEEEKEEQNEKDEIIRKLDEKDFKGIIEDVLKNKERYGDEARYFLGLYDNKDDRIEVLLGEVNFVEVERGFVEIIPMSRMVVLLKKNNYWTPGYSQFDDELYVFFYTVGWVRFS